MARSLTVIVALAPLAGWAAPPNFSKGGLLFGLQYGHGLWSLDRSRLAEQVGEPNADLFIGDAQNTHTASLRLGYNVLGHATLAAELTGTGWNVFDARRGGAGFLVGALHWHPLELVWPNQARPVPIDGSAFFGLGYGIAGQNRGMDGTVLELGITADYFFFPAVAFGLFLRGVLLQWSKFYIDYDRRTVEGNTLELTRGSGGAFFTFGISLDFRFAPE